jgi:hypothetical protein
MRIYPIKGRRAPNAQLVIASIERWYHSPIDRFSAPFEIEKWRQFADSKRLKMLVQANPQAANDPQIRKTIAYVSKKLGEEKQRKPAQTERASVGQ